MSRAERSVVYQSPSPGSLLVAWRAPRRRFFSVDSRGPMAVWRVRAWLAGAGSPSCRVDVSEGVSLLVAAELCCLVYVRFHALCSSIRRRFGALFVAQLVLVLAGEGLSRPAACFGMDARE